MVTIGVLLAAVLIVFVFVLSPRLRSTNPDEQLPTTEQR
jgi:hypothetical protein